MASAAAAVYFNPSFWKALFSSAESFLERPLEDEATKHLRLVAGILRQSPGSEMFVDMQWDRNQRLCWWSKEVMGEEVRQWARFWAQAYFSLENRLKRGGQP